MKEGKKERNSSSSSSSSSSSRPDTHSVPLQVENVSLFLLLGSYLLETKIQVGKIEDQEEDRWKHTVA
jgi:hypothetical protein